MNNTDIESLNHRYQILFNDFQANKIDEATFIAEVDKLQFQDEWSRYWMIGAQTGAWHYYDGQTWHQADPRDADKLPIMDEEGIYWQRGVKSGEWYFYDSDQSEWVKPNKNSPTQPTTPQANIAPEPALETAPPAGFEGELFQDNDGRYWATGAKSGQWYYYDHNGWHPAQNFEDAPPFQTQPDPAALTQPYPAYNTMAESQSYLPQPQMYSAPPQPPVQVYVVSPGQEGLGVGGQQPPQVAGNPAQPIAESSPLPKDDDIRPRQRPNPATNPEENREIGTATSEDGPVVPGESEVPPRQPSRPVGVAGHEAPSQAAAESGQASQAPNGGWYYFDGKNWSPSNGDTPSAGAETKSDPPLVQAISVDEGHDEVEVVDVEVIAVVEPEPEPAPVEPTPVASEPIQQPEPAAPSPTSAVWGASQTAASGVPAEEEVQPRRITRPIEPQPPIKEPQETQKPDPEKEIDHQSNKSTASRSRGAVVIPTGEDPANIPIRPSRPTSRPVRPAPRPAPAQQRRMRESTLAANRTPARSENYAARQTATPPAPAVQVQQAPATRTKTDEFSTAQVAQKVAPPAVTPATPPPTSPPINQPVQDVSEQTTFGEFLGAIPLTLRVFAVGVALLALFACGILALGGGFTQLDSFQDNIAKLNIPYLSDAVTQSMPTPTLDSNTIPDASPTIEATATPAKATATATPAGSVAFDSNFGFSLTYPENWHTLETNQAAMFAPTEANLDENTVTNAALQVGRSDEFDDVADLLAAMLARFPANAEELNKGSIGVGGDVWTSLQIRYDADSDSGLEQAVATIAVVMRDANEGYYLLATAPNTQWNELQPVYQDMINSFEFGASGAALVATASPIATTVADELEAEDADERLEVEPTEAVETATPKATATPAATATSTNTPTPKATPTSTSTPSPVTHEIQSGDTLGQIAAQYGIETSLLAEENGIDLENHTLQVGDELFIPIPQEALTSQPTPQATVAADDEAETTATRAAASDDDDSSTTSPKPTTGGITAEDIAGLKEDLDEIESEPGEISGRIIYPAFDPAPGVYNLWLVDLVTNEQTLLVAEASQPAFSQDGNLLAYRSWSLRDRGIVYRSYLNGKAGQVTNFVEDGLPAWSPDGFSFIFASRREGDRQPRLFRTDYQNKNDSGLGFEGVYPDVFPDGRIVASGCLAGGRDCGLYIMGGDGGGPKKIGPQGDTAPSASPNGKSIAFMSNGRGGSGWEIWTINDDGSNPKQVTENGSDDGLPVWSPDGKSIAFVSNQGGAWAVWVMNVDGSSQRKLFDMKGSPNGTVLSDSRNSFGWWEERISWAP